MKMKTIIWLVFILLFATTLPACDMFNPAVVARELSEGFESVDEVTGRASPLGRVFTDRLMAYMFDIVYEENIPGVAVAVVQGDTLGFAEGFGFSDLEERLPATPGTLFHIGSTQKSMTALLIAALVDEGLFDWDTPVVDIYPEFELSTEEATQSVTIRHLLSMQSGIPDYAEEDFDVDNATSEDLFTYIRDVPLIGEPGEVFSYSNISSSLAGYVGVLAADPQSTDLYTGYEQLLKKHVLDPIGMEMAVMRVSEAQKSPMYGKSYYLDGGFFVEAEPEDFDGDPLAPSGSLKVNLIEMAAYISTQLQRGVSPDGARVVSEENLVETWQPSLENYGMGWETSEIQGYTVISHEGSYDNYLSLIGFAPELNMGFVFLTNSADAGEALIEDGPSFLVNTWLEEVE